MANITFSQGSGLNDSVFGKSQDPIKFFLEKRAEAFEQQSMLKHLFSMMNSKNYAEKFTAMTAMDGFKPTGEGGEVPTDGMQESFAQTLEHMTWMNSFSITRAMIDDSKTIDLRQKPAQFITGYHRTRERFGAALYAGAINQRTEITFEGKKFKSSGADGLALFSKVHPSILSKNTKKQCNLFSDNFSKYALSAVESAMQDFRGDNDEILNLAPDTIVIANDYRLKDAVFSVIGADRDPATANNGFNYQFGRWNVVIWPYLNQYIGTGVSPWILMDSTYNEENKGAVWLDRTGLEVESDVERNRTNVWSGYSRFVAGFNDWRFAALGGMAGGNALVG